MNDALAAHDPNRSPEDTPGADTARNIALGERFHAALVARDWAAVRALLADDATWTLPGRNAISGRVEGGSAVVEHVRRVAEYGVRFDLRHVLVSRDNIALALHNTARRGDVVLDEHLAVVCRLTGGRIVEIETYLSDVPGMDAFFAR